MYRTLVCDPLSISLSDPPLFHIDCFNATQIQPCLSEKRFRLSQVTSFRSRDFPVSLSFVNSTGAKREIIDVFSDNEDEQCVPFVELSSCLL